MTTFSVLYLQFRIPLYHQVSFEELDRCAKRGGSRECPYYGACKESVVCVFFFKCALYDFQKQNFWDCLMKQVLIPDAFEAFRHGSIFNKAVFGWKTRYVSKQ